MTESNPTVEQMADLARYTYPIIAAHFPDLIDVDLSEHEVMELANDFIKRIKADPFHGLTRAGVVSAIRSCMESKKDGK